MFMKGQVRTSVDKVRERLVKQATWVQNLVFALEKERDEAIEAAKEARLTTKPDETDTVINAWDEVPVGLPNGARVRFKLNNGDWIDVRVYDNGQSVNVMASSMLVVSPTASNAVSLSIKGR